VEAIRAAVVDEHDIFRRGLVACLSDDPLVHVVMDGPSGPVESNPDVVVASPRAASGEKFECALVVCSPDVGSARRIAGPNTISAVLPRKSLTADQLSAAVRAAAVGLQVQTLAGDENEWWDSDARRIEILRLLAEGAGTQDIATALSYSERTIKGVIQEIERELGARSRAHAVAEGIRQGLI
jgi:DNA-binding NarL/FixJ family response regulator